MSVGGLMADNHLLGLLLQLLLLSGSQLFLHFLFCFPVEKALSGLLSATTSRV